MLHKRSISGCAAIVFLAASGWGGTIHDPAAGVIDDNFSTAISTFTGQFNPTANNGVFGMYNDTGAILTALFLHTTINTGLTAADINSSFTCNSGAANPFFLNCGFSYSSATGSLTISFFGVNPPDGDEFTGLDTEIGEQQGIPPINPRCFTNPNAVNCNNVGHFAFVFNNGFLTSGDLVNGWNTNTRSTANPNTFLFSVQPQFDAPQFTAAPEPCSLLLLGGGIFALGALSRRRLR